MSASEGPYKLPEGWRWVKLGEVADIRYGRAKPKEPGSVPVVGSGGVYDFTSTPLVSFPTIVIGRKGSAGEAILIQEPCWPSDTTFYLAWRFEVVPEWVFAWLGFIKPSPEGTTATLPSLRREDLEAHSLPLPPLSEQRRIVARIEELMGRIREARRLREEARQDIERLWQSVLAETFPHPGDKLPEGWRWVRLGEVVTFERRAKKPTELPPELPFVGMEHVEPDTGIVDIANLPSVSSVTSQVYLYNQNHVLYGRLRPYLNKVYLPKEEGACSAEFVPLKPNPSYVDRHFLAWYLRSSGFVSYANAHTTGARQPRVDPRALVAASLPLPPLSEQRRIVAHLEAVQERIQALKEEQAATQAELKRLEQAILEKAFRGEL